MIEFLMGRAKYADLSPEHQGNANTIVTRVNELLEAFGEYRACNSGYRSKEDQARINPKAMKSKHLIAAAIDISDADGRLYKFCKDNPELAERIGLWFEERQGGWLHTQCLPPASGRRWFNP